MALKLPPLMAVFACLILFGLGELAGATLGAFPNEIKSFTTERAKTHPEVHGLVGIEDIDRTILAKVSSETLSRLHTFHLHGHGVGLLTFVLFIIISSAGFSLSVKRILYTFTGLGMLYPFGWLTMMFLLPLKGSQASFKLVEKMFFMPFGGAMILAIWLLIFFFGFEIFKQLRK